MRTSPFRRRSTRKRESGQVMVFSLLAIGIFLMGAMAFAVDMGYLWFRRQAAQTAADAACVAGAMDLLVDAVNGTTTAGHFGNALTAAVPFNCYSTRPNNSTTNPAPCYYAALNGYNSGNQLSSTGVGNNVDVSFPTSVAGVAAPPPAIAPTSFMRVDVKDNAQTFFSGLLSGNRAQTVRAYAVCGVTEAAAPIPILVLDPQSPKSNPPQAALDIQGTPTIQIFGGPQRSIQVNSLDQATSCGKSNCSVNLPWGTATIDLSAAGPNGTGADMGLSGFPSAPPGGFTGGSTGHWIPLAAPIMDPFAQVCYPGQTSGCQSTINGFSAPAVPGPPSGVTASSGSSSTTCTAAQVVGGTCKVNYKENGCPILSGCVLYEPGNYPGGICVGSPCPGTPSTTAIFDPGLYYLGGNLNLDSNSTVRPGTGPGDGSGGTTFYFTGANIVTVNSNSGKATGLDPFNSLKGPVTTGGTQYPPTSTYSMGLKCTSGSVVPSNLQGGGAGVNINGNILLGPCTGYYGDPLGAAAPAIVGEQRWFLFFQDRSGIGAQPNWGGGGQFLLAGSMYFHSCNSSGSGAPCTPPPTPPTNSSYYNDIFSLGGTSGASTYVLGEIVADNLSLGGTSGITMDLNPASAFNILKASLYQ